MYSVTYLRISIVQPTIYTMTHETNVQCYGNAIYT